MCVSNLTQLRTLVCLLQGQLSTTDSADGGAGGFNAAALSHVWAWPLPHLDTSAWLPYEQVRRRTVPYCRTALGRSVLAYWLCGSAEPLYSY